MNHINLNSPILAFVADSLLYDNKSINTYTKCEIFSLGIYVGETITFDILLEDGSIFNYIPLSEIYYNIPKEKYTLNDLVYHNSMSQNISIQYYNTLTNKFGYAYIKNKIIFKRIKKYICTIDFFETNEILNLVILENDNFALLPNHKTLWFDKEQEVDRIKLKKYKKIRSVFKV